MSVEAMAFSIHQQVVEDPPARHVLLVMANYARRDGTACFVSAATIVKQTGLSERTVRAKIDLLERVGLLRRGNPKIVADYIERADRRPVCYDIAMSCGQVDSLPADGVQEMHPVDTTGCSSSRNGVHLVQERGAGAAPKPSNDPSTNPNTGSGSHRSGNASADKSLHKAGRPPARPESIPENVWEAFLAIWKAGRRPLSDVALEGIEREATKAGLSLEATLRLCCERGWRGFNADWVAADKSVQIGITLPSEAGPDPALTKIENDRKLAAPMPANIREQLMSLRSGRLLSPSAAASASALSHEQQQKIAEEIAL